MAAIVYKLKNGKRVPGASTVSKMIEDSGGLIYWAWGVGRDGKDLDTERRKAADAGTLAHQMVQASFEKRDPLAVLDGQPLDIAKPAETAFSAYLEWAAQTHLELVASEVSLVSEKHGYGGTLDAIGHASGRLALLDWKSGAIYPAHLLQIAGYRALWEEVQGSKIESVELVRFSKDSGMFAHYSFPLAVVDQAFEGFLHALELYKLRAVLKKVVG